MTRNEIKKMIKDEYYKIQVGLFDYKDGHFKVVQESLIGDYCVKIRNKNIYSRIDKKNPIVLEFHEDVTINSVRILNVNDEPSKEEYSNDVSYSKGYMKIFTKLDVDVSNLEPQYVHVPIEKNDKDKEPQTLNRFNNGNHQKNKKRWVTLENEWFYWGSIIVFVAVGVTLLIWLSGGLK
jgi:hypothetical protein